MASNGSFKRSIGVRVRDFQDGEHSQVMTDPPSELALDAMDEEI